MEQPENKIISNKINSLQGLPAGYQPNLDAKWALLQNEEKKKGVFIFTNGVTWLRVAAIILILLTSSIAYWNLTKTQTIVVTEPVIHDIPSVSPVQNFVEIQESKKENKSVQKIHKGKKVVVPVLNSIPIEKTEIAKTESKDDVIETAQPIATNIQPTEITKSKKARYVQIDIDDHLKENENSFYAQGVKIKFGINFNHKSGESTTHESTPLKISSNF